MPHGVHLTQSNTEAGGKMVAAYSSGQSMAFVSAELLADCEGALREGAEVDVQLADAIRREIDGREGHS